MKSNIFIFALILFPGIALSIAPKKRDFEPIEPKRVMRKIVKDKEAIHRTEQVFYGPHGKIELPTNPSQPENSLFPFPTPSFK
jgi:hypothetical protein